MRHQAVAGARSGTRARARGAGAVAFGLAAVAGLSGCGLTFDGDRVASVHLPRGTRLFERPPSTADCRLVDVVALRRLAGAQLPDASPVLAVEDPRYPRLTWAGCVGYLMRPGAAEGAPPSAAPSPSSSPPSSPSPSGAGPGPDGSAGGGTVPVERELVWTVSWATSAAADTSTPMANPLAGVGDVRTLTRRASVGDARVVIRLSVHADDHETLVLVTLYDRSTDRDAAECGIVGVPGSQADRAVQWCLSSLVRQLVPTAAPV